MDDCGNSRCKIIRAGFREVERSWGRGRGMWVVVGIGI